VFSTVTNPADVGMDKAPSNVTGVSDAVNYEASLALIKEWFPAASKIGVVFNPGEPNSQFGVSELRRLAGPMGLTLELVPISRSDEVSIAAQSIVERIDAFFVGSDNTVVGAIAGLVKVAEQQHVPVFASDSGSVSQGALAAVSVDYKKLGRRVGMIVADLIRNPRPAGQIPSEIFVGDTLIINAKAARRLGVAVPAQMRARALLVIE
jgi:putative ABC transport system substrate-binding protein